MSKALLVQIKDARIAVLYRRNGDNFRGRIYNDTTARWNKTSTIPLTDITCWRSISTENKDQDRWEPVIEAALASLPASETVDGEVVALKATTFKKRAAVAATQ